jgi:transcriptional regulator with XRE-family HTH domain
VGYNHHVDFPDLLRQHRTRGRLSQLDLALRADTTQRHLSFIESGRSTPGRAMVLRLAESLGVSLRQRNDLLLAAGYAPAYAETPWTAPDIAPIRSAIDHILAGHEPYPAVVVDRSGDIVAGNSGLALVTEGAAPNLVGIGRNAYRLALHPAGMAPRIVNFTDWAQHVLNGTRHLPQLHAELRGYVPALVPNDDYLGFAVPLRLQTSLGELHLMTTVTTFATAVDITLAELRLEAFLPADAATSEALRTAELSSSGRRVALAHGSGHGSGNW